MSVFIVSYDLNKNKDYSRIIKAIQTYPGCKLLLSMWAIKSNESISTIHATLKNYVDHDDELIVIKLVPGAMVAWSHLPDPVSSWLKANV